MGRYADNIKAVIRCPRTTKMVFRASANYKDPYKALTVVRGDLLELKRRGYLRRQEIPSTGRGQKEFVYFPTPKAKFFVPELESIKSRHPIYRGITESSPWHSLATSELVSEIERSAGEEKGKVRILAMLRPREFEAKVSVKTRRGKDQTKLIPDYTLVIEINGKPQLFFIEIQICTPVIIPISDQSISRSFQYKLTRYKVFNTHLRTHSSIRSWEEDFNCKIEGFKVLVVTTRGKQHLRNLMKANKGSKFDDMFLFTTTGRIQRGNAFSQPIWETTSENPTSLLEN